MKKNNKNGFTLVELLAVIVILAIILVIAVPQIMSTIKDTTKASLESSAKMVAAQVENQYTVAQTLGKEFGETGSCMQDWAGLNDVDYASCTYEITSNGTAKVTIKGQGKFKNLYVCNGTRSSAKATEDGCGENCSEEEAHVQNINVTKPSVVKDYNKCINYLRPIILSDDWGGNEGELISICKNRISYYYSFENLVYEMLDGEYFTEEELISNNIMASDSVFEQNITLGTPSSCVNYTKDVVINEWGWSVENLQTVCNDVNELNIFIEELLWKKIFTTEELIQNNVVGSDSVFTNIKPGNQTSCVNNLKDVVINEWGETESSLQTICSGKDVYVVTYMDNLVTSGLVLESDLIENNVIEGSIEEEKICVPNYADDAVTYINNLYNDTNIRSKFGLTKDNTSDQNIRYAGKYPQNYVEFGNTGELWRIIGTFEVEKVSGGTEELVKIVRDEPFKDGDGTLWMSWDSSASNINSGNGVNEWSQSDLKTMLNTYYIGNGTTCTYCNEWGKATCTNSCNSSVTPINSTYTSMIENVVWNTGAIEWNEEITPLQAYNAERESTTGKICSSTYKYCNDTVERKAEWEGKVGLMYLSDFGYAGGSTCTSITGVSCGQNNWLTNGTVYWTISPGANSGSASGVWSVGSDIARNDDSNADNGVRASLYLKSNVQIIDGDGSKNNPYKLK